MLERTSPDMRPGLLDLLCGARSGSGTWDIPDPPGGSGPLELSGLCTWDVPVLRTGDVTAASIPGLQETSLTGTRIAAYLLPLELTGHGIRLVTPVREIMVISLTGLDRVPGLTGSDSSGCWNRTVTVPGPGSVAIREECLLAPSAPDSAALEGILEGLAARCDGNRRMVIFR
jgi:hypothetical protein